MMIARQGVRHALALHDGERNAVGQRPALVGTSREELKPLVEPSGVWPDDGQLWINAKVADEGDDFLPVTRVTHRVRNFGQNPGRGEHAALEGRGVCDCTGVRV